MDVLGGDTVVPARARSRAAARAYAAAAAASGVAAVLLGGHPMAAVSTMVVVIGVFGGWAVLADRRMARSVQTAPAPTPGPVRLDPRRASVEGTRDALTRSAVLAVAMAVWSVIADQLLGGFGLGLTAQIVAAMVAMFAVDELLSGRVLARSETSSGLVAGVRRPRESPDEGAWARFRTAILPGRHDELIWLAQPR